MTDRPRYLLDTNIVSDLARHPSGPVFQRIVQAGPGSIAISIVVACEIRFGMAKCPSARLIGNIEPILETLEIIALDSPVELHYADIRHGLEKAGTPIGPNDLLIAAHARALDRILVTDNEREFARVPRLRIENWLK